MKTPDGVIIGSFVYLSLQDEFEGMKKILLLFCFTYSILLNNNGHAQVACGTVNTNGTTVVWMGGNKFVPGGLWNNMPIGINGINYTISSVTDSTHLTLYTSAGTQSNVVYSYSCTISGIVEINNQSFKIYPNPLTSSSTLQLNTQLKDAEVVISDMLGKEMVRKKLTGDRVEIERGSLESGVYFVRVREGERQFTQKIVIE